MPQVMTNNGSPEPPSGQPLRLAFSAELDQLRLQVELMAVRVDQNLERLRTVLHSGDARASEQAVDADDDIDAMSVSLTGRCYDLLAREQPVASDLRLIVSVLRVLGEFERIGDLALRVAKLAPEWELLSANRTTYDLLLSLADTAIERYRTAMRAWASLDADLARAVLSDPSIASLQEERLLTELLALNGPHAARTAIRTLVAGKSLERIADHAGIIAARLLYLVTGDSGHLAHEVR
jgi:phosphate transport system protein